MIGVVRVIGDIGAVRGLLSLVGLVVGVLVRKSARSFCKEDQ